MYLQSVSAASIRSAVAAWTTLNHHRPPGEPRSGSLTPSVRQVVIVALVLAFVDSPVMLI
jgi:hypothetical protein